MQSFPDCIFINQITSGFLKKEKLNCTGLCRFRCCDFIGCCIRIVFVLPVQLLVQFFNGCFMVFYYKAHYEYTNYKPQCKKMEGYKIKIIRGYQLIKHRIGLRITGNFRKIEIVFGKKKQTFGIDRILYNY